MLLLPLLIPQALWVRSRTLRLPEPEGKRSCVADTSDNAKKSISVLIAGDSAAAGVGVVNQSHALSGQCERCLSDCFHVSWHLFAKTGFKSAELLKQIEQLEISNIDVAVISIGVNDVTRFTSVASWRSHIQGITAHLLSHQRCKLIIYTALPPMHLFPALPQPLRWVLGKRALILNQVLCDEASKHPQVKMLFVPLNQNDSAHNYMALDGFHPGEAGYRLWAEAVAKLVNEELDGLVGNAFNLS